MLRYLALIGISKEPGFAQKKPAIEYNAEQFREHLGAALEVTNALAQ